MSILTLGIGLLGICAFIALVLGVLGLVLAAVRSSGKSASRGRGTGEGGPAYHGGTEPGASYGTAPDWGGRAGRTGEYSAQGDNGNGDARHH